MLQNVAVLKDEGAPAASSKDSQQRKRSIQKVNYDYYSRAIEKQDDGNWKVCNPVQLSTGLCYDPDSKLGADWYELFQEFLTHGYSTALTGSKVDEHPLLLSERSYNPPPVRQQMLECLFEELNVPATFLAKDAVLSCYGCGRTTATVVDVGYSGTTVTPVFDGYAELKGIRRSPAGVMAMDELILEQLDELYQKENAQAKQHQQQIMPLYQVRPLRPATPTKSLPRPRRSKQIHHPARLQIAQECREMGAGAAMNLQQQETTTFHAPHKPFSLPDGTVLDVPSVNRFAAADVVFGNDPASLQRREMLLEERKKELNALVDAAMKEDEEEDTDGDENMDDEGTKDKYSDAAAVGISKRRTKRGTIGSTGTAAAAAKQKRPIFSNRRLQAACAPHLQTLLDDQLTSLPIASMVCESAYKCDRDQQAALLGNVVLGGGGACLGPTEQAVPEVLREQVESILHAHTPGWRVKVLTPSIPERAILSWLGGSILGSLGTFHEMWITKAEYEEWGTAIVNRKCP